MDNLFGTGSAWDPYCAQVDFEAELAIVLGKALKNSGASEALEAVLGVTGANDISARRCGEKGWEVEFGEDLIFLFNSALIQTPKDPLVAEWWR